MFAYIGLISLRNGFVHSINSSKKTKKIKINENHDWRTYSTRTSPRSGGPGVATDYL